MHDSQALLPTTRCPFSPHKDTLNGRPEASWITAAVRERYLLRLMLGFHGVDVECLRLEATALA
jgi:hypothetical protein